MDLVANFAGLLACTVPFVIVHCNQDEAGHQTIKAPSMPCWGATGPWKHSLVSMPQDWWNWQIKWMKSVSVGSFGYKNQVNGEFFAYLRVILLYFSLESRLIPVVLELGKLKLFWKLIRSRIWQQSHSCQTGVWEYFPSSLTLNYNTRPTEKSPVRQQNAWFDRKMPGSTEKCPVRQKNALPRMHQLTLPLSNIPPPPPLRNIFFQFFSHIFLRTNREMKIKLFWY